MRARSALLAGVLGLLGCSSSTQYTSIENSSSNATYVTANISVAWGAQGASDEVRFDDPRLRRAVDETAAIVGQPVQFRFDLSLMPRPMGRFFDALFEQYIGRIPRDLERLAARDADVFAFGRERLRTIHFDYDGSVQSPALAFDPATGVLRIQMNGTSELVSYGAITYALTNAFRGYLEQTFHGAHAADVSPDQLRLYLRYLDQASGDREARAAVLTEALSLYDRARGSPELRQAITAFIVRRADMLGYEHIHHANEIAALPANSAFHTAEQAFARWVHASWAELGDRERRQMLQFMMIRRGGAGRDVDPFLRDAYPGVDLVALSLDVVDRWLAAGHPAPLRMDRDDSAQALYDFVVCPPHPTENTRYQRADCQGEVYLYASTDPALRARFLDGILQRQSVELTEAVFANLAGISSPHILDAWRRFENDPVQWAAATRAIAELSDYNRGYDRGELYDDSARIWRQRPAYRGSLLYLLATMEYPSASNLVNWREFGRIFGSLATRQDLDSYLANGDGALVRVAVIVPALAPRVGIVEALTPHLDRTIGDDGLRRRYRFFPYEVLRDLVDALRARGDGANLSALRRYFQDRIASHPSEQRWLETLVQMTSR